MTCTAVVDPDTEAFCDGPCADCGSVVLTDPDGVAGRSAAVTRLSVPNPAMYALCTESGSTRRYENELNE